ncbi:hypothetical protein PO909_007598, partial [Leuciscus waleckii]
RRREVSEGRGHKHEKWNTAVHSALNLLFFRLRRSKQEELLQEKLLTYYCKDGD